MKKFTGPRAHGAKLADFEMAKLWREIRYAPPSGAHVPQYRSGTRQAGPDIPLLVVTTIQPGPLLPVNRIAKLGTAVK